MSRYFKASHILIALTVAFICFDLYARAGGGGGGGGGGGSFGRGVGGSMFQGIIFLILLPFVLLYQAYVEFRIKRRKKEVQAALGKMKTIEPEWSEENLLNIAREKFILLQKLWGNQDLDELEKHLTRELFKNWKMQIEEQQYKGESNPMIRLDIHDAFIVDVKNYINDNDDLYTVCFDASGDDQTWRDGKLASSDLSNFREFWIFRKQEGDWKLFGVAQVEGWKRLVDGNLVFERLSRHSQLTP